MTLITLITKVDNIYNDINNTYNKGRNEHYRVALYTMITLYTMTLIHL